MARLTSVDDAIATVLAHATVLPTEDVATDAADGRVLAEPAVAAIDLPPFPSSSMDGYAIRVDDVPGTLAIVGEAAAGRPSGLVLRSGEAIAVSTGGVVPTGADAVVPIEHVSVSQGRVTVPAAVVDKANIRGQGGDVRQGTVIARAGDAVSPRVLAGLAAAGVARVRCARRPSVAIVTTGTELRAPGERLADGQIYESNGPMLAALCERAGATVSLTRGVADDSASHRTALAAALEYDVVVTSGGVSVGQHDLVRGTLEDLGATELLWGVAMRPGKPLLLAQRGRTLVFGLPGNPVSSLVSAMLFVVPTLAALQGLIEPGPCFAHGTLASAVTARPDRDDFPRAGLEIGASGVAVLEPLRGQESHMIVASSRADAVIRIPAGLGTIPAGSAVDYLRLD